MNSLMICGGMGPRATLQFERLLIQRLDGFEERDFPRILIDNNPNLPSRNLGYLNGDIQLTTIFEEIIEHYIPLGFEYFAFPCNSAHHFLGLMSNENQSRVVSIVDAVAISLERLSLGAPLILGAEAVTFGRIYSRRNQKFKESYLEAEDFHFLRRIIDDVKDGRTGLESDGFFKLKMVLNKYKFDSLVLACTELGFYDWSSVGAPVVDSNIALVDLVFERIR